MLIDGAEMGVEVYGFGFDFVGSNLRSSGEYYWLSFYILHLALASPLPASPSFWRLDCG